MVYRIFVEKKEGLDNEAKGLLNEAKNLLGIAGIKNIRLFNRYDAENIEEGLFNYCINNLQDFHKCYTKGAGLLA